MTDIALLWSTDLLGADIALAGPDLATDDGLATAVTISLFSDARAAEDDVLPTGDGDRRGWWGDALIAEPQDRIGSRLWLLAREKRLATVLERARGYADSALAWLVSDGVAKAVRCSAEALARDTIALSVEIDRPDGRHTQLKFRHRFDHVWEAMA